MQSGGWPYSEVGRDSEKLESTDSSHFHCTMCTFIPGWSWLALSALVFQIGVRSAMLKINQFKHFELINIFTSIVVRFKCSRFNDGISEDLLTYCKF